MIIRMRGGVWQTVNSVKHVSRCTYRHIEFADGDIQCQLLGITDAFTLASWAVPVECLMHAIESQSLLCVIFRFVGQFLALINLFGQDVLHLFEGIFDELLCLFSMLLCQVL